MARRVVTSREQADLAEPFLRLAAPPDEQDPLASWEQDLLSQAAEQQEIQESTPEPVSPPPGITPELLLQHYPEYENPTETLGHFFVDKPVESQQQKVQTHIDNITKPGSGMFSPENAKKWKAIHQEAFGDPYTGRYEPQDEPQGKHTSGLSSDLAQRLGNDLLGSAWTSLDVDDQKSAVKEAIEKAHSVGLKNQYAQLYHHAFGDDENDPTPREPGSPHMVMDQIAYHPDFKHWLWTQHGKTTMDGDPAPHFGEYADHLGAGSNTKAEQIADDETSPTGYRAWVKENDAGGGWYDPTPHFQEWMEENHSDWEPSNWDTYSDIWAQYAYPFDHETPDWWNFAYGDDAAGALSDWQGEIGPEEAQDFYSSFNHGGDKAQASFESYLDDNGIEYLDGLDKILTGEGIDTSDYSDYSEWKSDLDDNAIDYYKSHPQDALSDYYSWADYYNNESLFFTPSYPGANTKVKYSTIDNPFDGVPDNLRTNYKTAYQSGVLPWLLSQFPEIDSDDWLSENLSDGEWQDLSERWDQLPHDEKSEFLKLENQNLHPSASKYNFTPPDPHKAIIGSQGFKEFFKQDNNGFDLKDPSNAQTLKQLEDSHNPWVIGKVVRYLEHLKNTGQAPDFTKAANEYGQMQNDPQFYNWVNNQSAAHKVLYSYAPQYALNHFAEKDNPPPGFKAYHAAHPELSVLEALPKFHDLDAGKGIWVNKEKGGVNTSTTPPAQQQPTVQGIIDALVQHGNGSWSWNPDNESASSVGLNNLAKNPSLDFAKTKLEQWAQGHGLAGGGDNQAAAKKVYDLFFGSGAAAVASGITIPPHQNVPSSVLNPDGTLEKGFLNWLWDEYGSSTSHGKDGKWLTWITNKPQDETFAGGWSPNDWKYVAEAWNKLSPATQEHWQSQSVPQELTEQDGYQSAAPGSSWPSWPSLGVIESIVDKHVSDHDIASKLVKNIHEMSPEKFEETLRFAKENNYLPGGSVWGDLLKHMEDQGWKPGVTIGTAAPASTLKYDWSKLKLGPLPSILVDGDSEDQWALKPGLAEFLESQHISPVQFRNLDYAEQAKLGHEFKNLGIADAPGVGEDQRQKWSDALTTKMNKDWVTSTEDYSLWLGNLTPAALKYFNDHPELASKDFNTFLEHYNEPGKIGPGYKTLPVPSLHGEDLTDEELAPNSYPEISLSNIYATVPATLKDPVTGDLDPHFTKWLWKASDKTLAPDQFAHKVHSWDSSHWKAIEKAYFQNPDVEESPDVNSAATQKDSSGFSLPSKDLVADLGDLMDDSGYWSTHKSDNWNAWAHTLTDEQLQNYIDEYKLHNVPSNSADKDFRDFFTYKWESEENAGFKHVKDKITKNHFPVVGHAKKWARDVGQAFAKWKWEQNNPGGAAGAGSVKGGSPELYDALMAVAPNAGWLKSSWSGDVDDEMLKGYLKKHIADAVKDSKGELAQKLEKVYDQFFTNGELYDQFFDGGDQATPAATAVKAFDPDAINEMLLEADEGHWQWDIGSLESPQDYENAISNLLQEGIKDIRYSGEGAYTYEELDIYKKILADYFGVDEKGDPVFDNQAFYKDFKTQFPKSIVEPEDLNTAEKAREKIKDLISTFDMPESSHGKKLQELYDKWFGSPAPSTPSPPPPPPLPPGINDYPDPNDVGDGPAPLDYAVRQDLGMLSDKIRAEHTIYTDDDLEIVRTPKFQQWFAEAPSDYRVVSRNFPYIAIDDFKSGGEPGWVPQGDPGDFAQTYQLEHWPTAEEAGGRIKTPGGQSLKLPNHPLNQWPSKTLNPRSDDKARPNDELEFVPRKPLVENQLEIPLPKGSNWEPEYTPPTIRRGINIELDRYRPDGKHHHLLRADGEEGARHRRAAQMLEEIRELVLGPAKKKDSDETHYRRDNYDPLTQGPYAKDGVGVQESLFDLTDKSELPEGMPSVNRHSSPDDWLELFTWGQKNDLTPEQMWMMAKKSGSKTPDRWGEAPLSWLVAQAKHNPRPMAKEIGRLIGDDNYLKDFDKEGGDLRTIAGKLKRISKNQEYGTLYSSEVQQRAEQLYDKWFGEGFLNEVLAHKILEYLETGGWKPTNFGSHPDPGGMGPHWTTHSKTEFGDQSPSKENFPVAIEAEWPGSGALQRGIGEDPDRKDDARGYTSEKELTINPGTPLRITKVKMRHPLYHDTSKWLDLDVTPHIRHANLVAPIRARKRGRAVLSHQERFAWEWQDNDEPPVGPDGGEPSSMDTPLYRAEERPALGDGSYYFSPREVNPPSTSSSRPEVYRGTRVDDQDSLPGMPTSLTDVPMWRGFSIDLHHPAAAEIHRKIFGEHPNDEYLLDHESRAPRYDHPELGHEILEYLENNRPRGTGRLDPHHGLGPHWSLNPVTAKDFALSEAYSALNSPDSLQLPVRVKGNWSGVGENPYRDGTGETYDGEFANEDEINLLAGAPMNISNVEVRHPHTKQWIPVLKTPQQRLADATPIPARPRTAKRIVTQREWLEG